MTPRAGNTRKKIRKAIKWGGAAATVLLAVVWVCSLGSFIRCSNGKGFTTGIAGGQVFACRNGWLLMHEPKGVYVGESADPSIVWWPVWEAMGPTAKWQGEWLLTIPLWLFALPCLLIAAGAWRCDARATRRAHAGCCPTCNYPRCGLPAAAVCPECGATPTAANTNAPAYK